MSCNYADGLSSYENKGVLGLAEKFDSEDAIETKLTILTEWILQSRHVVIHTGAGISTSAGIPDFRGPNGVWTLEKRGLKPTINLSFDEAQPSLTHLALTKLVETDYVKFVVSQNIDGLHLKSGLNRNSIAELHGNMFTERCNVCERQFVRNTATISVGQKSLGQSCPGQRISGRPCRGKLHDTILDWEANLPAEDLDLAFYHSHLADLNICLGTTLQIVPSGNLPLHSRKYGGKLVIVNLQPTKHDSKASLIINTYVDGLLKKLMKKLGLELPEYSIETDPTKNRNCHLLDWTLTAEIVKKTQQLYEQLCKKKKRKLPNAILTKNKLKKDDTNESKEEIKQNDIKIDKLPNDILSKKDSKEEIKQNDIKIEDL